MNAARRVLLSSILFAACTLDQGGDAPFGESSPTSGAPEATSGSTGAVDPPEVVTTVCERLDACGFLPPGIRARDCQDVTASCLEGSLQSEQADWDLVVGQCLAFENCFNFLECYEGLATCEFEVGDTEHTGGLDPTSGVGDSTGPGAEGGSDASTSEAVTTEGGGDTTGASTDDTSSEPPLPCDAGTCDDCLGCASDGPCALERDICSANPECVSISGCYADCNDEACLDVCDLLYPEGITDYHLFVGCALGECPSTC